jgi:aminoglycoside phosphotransferase (APT) family kinase protein
LDVQRVSVSANELLANAFVAYRGTSAITNLGESEFSDETVAGMISHLVPSWDVVNVDTVEEGSNTTAIVNAETPDGERTVVLKAATSTWPGADDKTRAEPRLLSLVHEETSIPVPGMHGVCDDHGTYPTPFFLMEHVDGECFSQDQAPEMPSSMRKTIVREAGQHMAELHMLGPLPAVGDIVCYDGDITIRDTEASPSYDDFHEWLLDHYEETLDQLEENGGYFPDLTEDPNRFTDLVPEIRAYLRETIPDLSDPDPPTYCHKDYRYGNLVVNPETGTANAVIDWGILMAAPPAFNIAITEGKLLKPDHNGDSNPTTGRAGELRDVMWDAYTAKRDGWTFDEGTRERIHVYRLAYRLDSMACLPLYFSTDPTLDDREARADEHREFVAQYL